MALADAAANIELPQPRTEHSRLRFGDSHTSIPGVDVRRGEDHSTNVTRFNQMPAAETARAGAKG
jgi:hypothetical protein